MIGKRSSASFRKPGKLIVKRPDADDNDDDSYFEPSKPPKLNRLKPVAKKASPQKDVEPSKPKKAVEPGPEESDVEDEDDDFLEERKPSRQELRQLALSTAETRGVKSFEIEPEEMEDESYENEKRHENARKNDEKIIATGVVEGGDQRKIRGLTTLFGQRSDTILRMLDRDDDTDGALTLIHRTLLQTLVDVLPVVERSVRRSKGKRGVMPFNQLISQVRELVTDIQALRDKGQLGASIVERVVRPAYLDLASQIVVAFMEIEASSRSRMSPEDFKTFRDEVLLTTKKSLAQYIHAQYETIKNDVVSSLS